jgi:hypothetical protein
MKSTAFAAVTKRERSVHPIHANSIVAQPARLSTSGLEGAPSIVHVHTMQAAAAHYTKDNQHIPWVSLLILLDNRGPGPGTLQIKSTVLPAPFKNQQ